MLWTLRIVDIVASNMQQGAKLPPSEENVSGCAHFFDSCCLVINLLCETDNLIDRTSDCSPPPPDLEHAP